MTDIYDPFEENEIPSLSEKRKTGGQPGNRNALKHGLYSRLLLPDEKKSLDRDSVGKLDDEITMMRALLYRTLKSFKENPPASFMDHIHALRAISFAVTSLQGVFRAQKIVYNENGHTVEEVMQEIMEELGKLPPEID